MTRAEQTPGGRACLYECLRADMRYGWMLVVGAGIYTCGGDVRRVNTRASGGLPRRPPARPGEMVVRWVYVERAANARTFGCGTRGVDAATRQRGYAGRV